MTPDPLLEDLSHTLNTPLLQLGEISITPLFLIKTAVFLLALVVLAAFTRRRLVLRLLARTNVDDGVKYATARIAGYLVWIFGLLAGLPLLGIRLSSVLVAFGAVGIGIGLGLQKIAENFISGLILLFGRPVKVGDRVTVGNVTGTVLDIQTRVTTVRTNDNVIVLVPNGELVSQQVVNQTHNDKLVRFNFPVGVSYDSDPDRVRECLLEVAATHPELLKKPEPAVFFLGFGESSLDFKLSAYTSTMVHNPEVLVSEMNFAIWYRLKAANITIPFPQRDLHIKSIAPEARRLTG